MKTIGNGLCNWHIGTIGDSSDAAYCGKPTTYVMVWDGGEVGSSKTRKYDHLCPEHRTKQDVRDAQKAMEAE